MVGLGVERQADRQTESRRRRDGERKNTTADKKSDGINCQPGAECEEEKARQGKREKEKKKRKRWGQGTADTKYVDMMDEE